MATQKATPAGSKRPFVRKILWQAWTVTFKAAAGPILKGLVCIKLCVAARRTTNYNTWLAIVDGVICIVRAGEKFSLARVANDVVSKARVRAYFIKGEAADEFIEMTQFLTAQVPLRYKLWKQIRIFQVILTDCIFIQLLFYEKIYALCSV